MLNVFDHQRFLMRRPDGTRITRTFRELLTATTAEGEALDPDEPLRLDYPHVFFNIGAMGLMTYLIHVAFEPADDDELARRFEEPVPVDEFEAAVAPLRERFSIDGSGTSRFMQGPPPLPDKKGKLPKPDDVSTIMLTVRKDNSLNKMEWLNRRDTTWAVALDQVPLLLFTRNTFYEQAGGAGYQKGTAGEVAIRTLLVERDQRGFPRLRRSVWHNVLHRRFQRDVFPADFAVDRPGVDGFMWEALPDGEVPTGGTTLAAGLGWMTAYHHLQIEDVPEGRPATCMVTGRVLTGPAATGVWKGPTGIAYGTKGDEAAGKRASRLFRHPNVPTYTTWDKKTGSYENDRQLTVHRTRGLVDAMGAVFFGMKKKGAGRQYSVAPVLDQVLYAAFDSNLEDYYEAHRADLALHVFGFHMVGSMGGKHSGYEHDAFTYPVLRGRTPEETQDLLHQAQQLMHEVSEQAETVAGLLQRALQETAGVSVEWSVDHHGRLSVKRREKKTAADFEFGRDVLAAYWKGIGELLPGFVRQIAKQGADPATLAAAHTELLHTWGEKLASLARRLYRPHFEHFSTQPKTMSFAHHAARRFYRTLRKITRALAEPTEPA